MTTLTMRMIKGHFVVSGPDVEPMKFKTRPEARDWCRTHHPGSPITEIGPSGKRAAAKRGRGRLGNKNAPAARAESGRGILRGGEGRWLMLRFAAVGLQFERRALAQPPAKLLQEIHHGAGGHIGPFIVFHSGRDFGDV